MTKEILKLHQYPKSSNRDKNIVKDVKSNDELIAHVISECDAYLDRYGFLTFSKIESECRNCKLDYLGTYRVQSDKNNLIFWGGLNDNYMTIVDNLMSKYKMKYCNRFLYCLNGFYLFQNVVNELKDCEEMSWLPICFVKEGGIKMKRDGEIFTFEGELNEKYDDKEIVWR